MSQIVVFHGAEHRAGCTMAAQSTAELAAKEKKELAVLFAALNGRRSAGYISEKTVCMDEFKIQLKSGIGIDKNALSPSKKISNLYIIAGAEKEEEARGFFPDMADVLVESLSDKFDLIIIDSGSEADNGLALGALRLNGLKYLVMEQAESSVRRYEKMRALYEKLDIKFNKYVLSKYSADDPLTSSYVSARLGLDKSLFLELSYQDGGRAAEMEYRTMLEAGPEKYKSDIAEMANDVMKAMSLEKISL